MGFCRGISELYLKFVNIVVLIGSLLILGYSAYLAGTLGNDFDLDSAGARDPVLASIIFGAALLLFSIIGLVAACKDSKCLLLIYILGSSLVALGVIAIGAVLLHYNNSLENVRDGQVDRKVEQVVVDFELALFQQCCDGIVIVCDDIDKEPCVHDEDRFEEFVDAIGEKDDSTCEAMLEIDEVKDCGNGVPDIFVQDASQFMEDNLRPFAIVTLVAGIGLALVLFSACVLLWTRDDDDKK